MKPRKQAVALMKHVDHMKLLYLLGLAVLCISLAAVLVVLLEFLRLPSEISTLLLVMVLLGMVTITGIVIWLVLKAAEDDAHRFAIAGVALLAVGLAIAFGLLPEHNASGPSQGAVGVLPPAPATTPNRGFEVGLSVEPRGCGESVSTKFVVNGSKAYWSEHAEPYWSAHRYGVKKWEWPAFVVVLPGRYSDVNIGLGREMVFPTQDPQQQDIVKEKEVESELEYEKTSPRKLDATIISGRVRRWWKSQRPLIITATANWVSRRGVSDCYLQVPPLSGPSSAITLVEALTCPGLDIRYQAGTCTPVVSAASSKIVSMRAGVEVGKAATMISGGNLNPIEAVPRPGTVDGSSGWTCEAPVSTSVSGPVGGGTEGEKGLESAAAASANDCQALATIGGSSWHHDFLLVLIGALLGVGVHMLFQSMVEGPRRRREPAAEANDQAPAG
jgi:hypothetical protein